MKSHHFRRICLAVLLSLVLTVTAIPGLSAFAQTNGSVQQVHNLVLFAQFDPLSEKNFMETYTQEMINMCNDDSTYRSLSKYIDTISNGKMKVTSYFPQLKDGVIQPYVLQQSREEYTDYNQYAVEMLQNIPVPEDIPLDGNFDGFVDNVVLVVDGQANTVEDPLWAKAFFVGGLNINGSTVGYVNLQNGYGMVHSTLFNGIGTLCHEFLHSMGYPDLYHRSDVSGDPVGQWDIMCYASYFLQYPLAYQRYAISGWLDAETITTNGTYTLQPASASEGSRLYLLKTSLSDTEFFAVEYRRSGTLYSDELDQKIYGDGMVVYRVNTAAHGNYKSDTDEIYVFRPNETTLNAGEGDLTRSCYGGENAPDYIGTTDLQKGVADGALVYSDGTNSGIALSDIQIQENGTLTFSAEFADVSEKQLWQAVSNVTLPAGQYNYDFTKGTDGELYLFSASSGAASLYKLENDALTAVSTPLSKNINNPKLAFAGGTPYVLYQDDQYLLHLSRWDSASGAWTECYAGSELAQYMDMTSDGKKLYFTYTTGSYPYVLYGASYDPATETVSVLGSAIAQNACNMEIEVAAGKVFVGYRDLDSNSVPKLAVFQGELWESTALSDQSCGSVSTLADGDAVWILPTDGKNGVSRWENDAVTTYALPEGMKDRAFQMIPVVAEGKFYVAMNAQNPEEFPLYGLNLETGTWEQTGNNIAREMVNHPLLAAQKNTLYCLYTASDQTVLLKKLLLPTGTKPEPEIVSGDIDQDGICSLTDLVLLQQYLLNQKSLTEQQTALADLSADQTVNGMDLVLLKQLVLQNTAQ